VVSVDIKRIERTLNEINRFGYSDKGINRLAYSKDEQQASGYLIQACQEEGMQVRVDECGNIIARREGVNPDLPVVAFGSHLDSVIQGGKYDGTIGVVAGLEVIRMLNEKRIETEHPIELISFACEESSRFGVSTIGSKMMAGKITKESISQLTDQKGISIHEAFTECGLNFEHVEKAARSKQEFKAFLEMHIEQGPYLETTNNKIGIVTGIAAPTRLKVEVNGKASHSGTTSMDYRKDALLGASEIALYLERLAKSESGNGTVATIGVMDVKPGAMNVVPGFVDMYIDIRGTSTTSKLDVLNDLLLCFRDVSSRRGLMIDWEVLSDEEPVLLDQNLTKLLSETCEKLGISYVQMPSGAGHDVMNMAHLCPSGLIFVPSLDGLSHHPNEFTALDEIVIGIKLLEEMILNLSNSQSVYSINQNRIS
jgi:hydantoinase/carbamoylase family amidase